MSELRLGSVPYLNAAPLIWPIEHGLTGPQQTVTRAVPRELADMLAAGEIDCALAPVAVLLSDPGLVPLPDVAVACRGPVASVLLFHKDPFDELSVIWLDPSSLTSNLLVQVLRSMASDKPCQFMAPLDGSEAPSIEELPRECGRLLIGDPALAYVSKHPGNTNFTDLGSLWKEKTNLPFTFALWIARSADIAARLAPVVRQARDWSVLHLHEMIHPLAIAHGFEPELVDRYLRINVTYMFGPREEAGMREFFKLARRIRP